jgi:flagellin-like protein
MRFWRLSTSRRRGRATGSAARRGIETIIATILMVAVVVILAAVLYVLIVPLVHSSGATPIGSAFAAGSPAASVCTAGSSQVIGASPVSGGCNPGDYIYTLTVESSSVRFSDALFEVRAPDGTVYASAGATGSFAILDPAGHVAAVSVTGSNAAMLSAWSSFGPTSTAPSYSATTPLTNTFTIVLDLGSASAPSGKGLAFVALGVGPYSGSTSPLALP